MHLYEFDSFRFDVRTRLLLQDGREIQLPRKTADLLLLFVQRPGQVILKEELVSSVWPDTSVADNSLTFAIHQLREALGCREGGQSYIETLPKRGYRLVATVREIHPEQVRTSVPLSPPEEPAKDAIQDLQRQLFAKDQQHSQLLHRLASFAIIGAVALLVLAGGVIQFRLKPNPRLRVASYSQLTSDSHEKGGVLLTDGSRIYFKERGSTGWQLDSAAVEGGPISTLPISMQGTTVFDISPFRSEILTARPTSNEDAPDLWIMSLLGGPPRRIGALKGDAAVWSPDEARIASVLGTGLFISASDGTGTRKIATIPAGASWLSWSPDEKTLRFSSSEYRNGDMQGTLWEVKVDGTSLHQILAGWNNPPSECCGSWTPDGRFYVFQSTRNGHTDLWTIPERRTFLGEPTLAPVRLSSGPLDVRGPRVSSDGKRVFAMGTQERGELVSYNSQVHDFVKFLRGISATWVIFSKSGRLAYIEYPDLTVWRANAGGGEKTQITFSPLQANGLSWSPDEKWLAVRARTPGHAWRIYLVPSQGGEPQPLMAGETEQGVPTHKLSDLPGSSGLWELSSWRTCTIFRSGLSPKNEPLLLRNLSTTEIYSLALEYK